MADGINIRVLPKVNIIQPSDLILTDNVNLGTRTVTFSSIVLSGSQISFYQDFLNLSNNFENLSSTTTTLLSGGISPSGSITPNKIGIFYFAANTKDYFVSVGTLNNKDWKRISTVNY